ncbi:MFS transporter [Streptomyces hygroscopicus]|uniref:MFS transporter n=1 Tax=Streptomyces hygroscopicus TaxID=1912 RepID=UPI0027E21D50|nr:MFS transporter [Streptomyces hygroscopicus]
MTQHGPGPERPGRKPAGEDRWALVAVAGVLAFVAMLDMNIVNVALADIADGLDVSAATAQWAVLAYQLPVVAFLLPVGRWLDGGGTRLVVPAATAGFGLSSALAAVAPWAGWLIAARLAQGAFGAALFVLMPVLAMRAVRPELRGRAMSVPATLGPLGAVTGPAVGGLLLDHFGWRSVFLVKIPFCLLALVLVWRAMPRDGRPRPVAAGRAAGGHRRGGAPAAADPGVGGSRVAGARGRRRSAAVVVAARSGRPPGGRCAAGPGAAAGARGGAGAGRRIRRHALRRGPAPPA